MRDCRSTARITASISPFLYEAQTEQTEAVILKTSGDAGETWECVVGERRCAVKKLVFPKMADAF